MATNSSVKKIITIEVQGKNASVSIDGVKSSFKQLNTEITRMKTGMQETNMATGSASATVLELGRAVSDSNYGIRGMANNLSQLASNFVYTTKQAGTFGGGLMAIKNAMLGPLGFILLFQTGIALLERWAINSEKSTEATEDFSDTLAGAQGSAATNLKVLRDTLKKNMLTQEEANDAVRRANKEYKGLNLRLDENHQLTEDSVFAIDVKIIALERLAKATALQSKLSEKYGELLELEAKQTELDVKAKEAQSKATNVLGKSLESNIQIYGNTNNVLMGAISAADESGDLIFANAKKAQKDGVDAIKQLNEEIQALLKIGGDEGLISEMFKGKDSKGGRGKTAKDILEEEFQFDLQAWYRGELAKFDMARQMEFELQEEILDRRRGFTQESLEMQSEANLTLLNDRIKHEELMLSHTLLTDEERVEKEQTLSLMRIELQDKELEHELMIIDLKMQAQLEYVDFVSGIGQVFATLGKENEALAKVGLVLQKGAAIAGVVIENTAANQAIMSAGREEASEYKKKAAAAPPGLGQAVFGAAATAALLGAKKKVTKNNVGAGIAIANILATTLASKTMSGGGGTAGGDEGGGRAFDFNLVGSTGTNQLAEAVGGQFQQPVQAFVVSSEMTSQQELDLQIEAGASVGD